MRTSHRHVVIHGLIAGAIGYVVVGLLFGVLDFLLGRQPFATAAYVGAQLTGQVFGAAPGGFAAAPLLAFQALQLVVMLAAGLLGSRLVHRSRGAGVLPFFAFGAGVLATLLASFALAAGLFGAVYAVDLVWINLAAAAAVASYLVVRAQWPAPRSAKPA